MVRERKDILERSWWIVWGLTWRNLLLHNTWPHIRWCGCVTLGLMDSSPLCMSMFFFIFIVGKDLCSYVSLCLSMYRFTTLYPIPSVFSPFAGSHIRTLLSKVSCICLLHSMTYFHLVCSFYKFSLFVYRWSYNDSRFSVYRELSTESSLLI